MPDLRPPSWRRVVDEAVQVLVLIGETALLWMLTASLLAVSEEQTVSIAPWIIFAVLASGTLVPRLFEWINLRDPWYASSIGASIAVVTVITVKIVSFPDFALMERGWLDEARQSLIARDSTAEVTIWFPLGLVAVAWWRGRLRERPSVDSANQFLRVGLGISLFGALLFTISAHRTGENGAGAILIFFTAAVANIGLSRAANADRVGHQKLTARAVGVALIPAALTALVATLLVGIITQDVIDTFVWMLEPVLWLITFVLQIVVLVIAVIILIILTPFIYLLKGHTPSFQATGVDMRSPFGTGEQEERLTHFELVPDPIRYLLVALLIILIFGGLTRFVLRRSAKANSEEEGVERESTRPVLDLRSWLNSLLTSLGFGHSGVAIDPLAELRGDPRWASTVAIREAYTRLLEWSQKKGRGRAIGDTTGEFGAQLTPQLGASQGADLTTLTRLYDRARYSHEPASSDEAIAARTALERIQLEKS